jgi:protein TonB
MIKTVLLFLITVIPSLSAWAQTDSLSQQTVYEFAQEAPQFPGGGTAWYQYLQTNLQYPPNALKAGLEDRIFVNFIVTQQGKITDVHALKHPNKVYNPDLVREAERLIRNMPTWIPGKVGGRTVASRFNMPVTFSLK